jgi:hypothetical protein
MTALTVPGNTWNIMGIVKSSDYLKALLLLAKIWLQDSRNYGSYFSVFT